MTTTEPVFTTVASPSRTTAPPLRALRYVSVDDADRRAAATDRSGHPGVLPLAVAYPESVAEVQDVIRAAAHARKPVTVRGAGTGMAGGAVPTPDTVVLDLSRLTRIVSIDLVNRIAVVEPGVITADLDDAARAVGLRYAPDPASAAISTVGGNIATNAGGLRCVKYGVTRDAVRALDVVLADGRLLRTGAATVKSVTGYDLTGLFVGSEGTLGVIVGATVALRPLPHATATLRASFADIQSAADAVLNLLATGVTPAVAEVMDAATLGAVDAYLGTELSAHGGALLIVQTESHAAEVEIEAVRAAIAGTAQGVVVTRGEDDGAGLLAARRAALPAVERFGTAYIEDICVPLSRLAEAVTRIGQIADRHGVRIFTFAHAADGNVHPIIVAARPDEPVQSAADDIFALALELGGTVTGEHGVGLLKRDWAARELDPVALGVQYDLRRALDPHGLLNPGKAI